MSEWIYIIIAGIVCIPMVFTPKEEIKFLGVCVSFVIFIIGLIFFPQLFSDF